MVVGFVAHGGHATSIIDAAGSIIVTNIDVPVFKPSGHSIHQESIIRSVPPEPAVDRSPSAPIAKMAAIALSGSRADAARPPTQQARREARKALQQLPMSKKESARVSRLALVGAVLQLGSRMFAAVGLIIQRAASADDTQVLLRRVGLATYMVSAVPDMLSFLLAPKAVLTVLSSIEPLLVSVLAALLLPQDAALLTSQQSLATVMCVAGTLGTVLFAPVGVAALQGNAMNAAALSKTNGLWDVTQGAEGLFGQSAAHRLMLYLIIVVPLLIYLSQQVSRDKHWHALASTGAFPAFWLMLVAAMSLALQRLTLAMLGVSLHAVHWDTWLVLTSPTIIGMAVIVMVCMLSCVHHVCRGVSETPPHIFVPVYCATSSLLQLFQSMVIMQEFRDEPAEKVLLTFACAAVSVSAIVHLSTSQGRKAAGPIGSSVHDVNCLEPLAFDTKVDAPAEKEIRHSVTAFSQPW